MCFSYLFYVSGKRHVFSNFSYWYLLLKAIAPGGISYFCDFIRFLFVHSLSLALSIDPIQSCRFSKKEQIVRAFKTFLLWACCTALLFFLIFIFCEELEQLSSAIGFLQWNKNQDKGSRVSSDKYRKPAGVLKWSLDIRAPLVLIPLLIDATVSSALPHGQYL